MLRTLARCQLVLNVSHHLPKNDDFWSQLFVNGKDVNETEGEDHVVHTKDIPAKSIRPLEHPEHRMKEIHFGNSTTQWTTRKITALTGGCNEEGAHTLSQVTGLKTYEIYEMICQLLDCQLLWKILLYSNINISQLSQCVTVVTCR